MNARQKKFCDEYIISCNAARAALKAGYSKSTAKQASKWINGSAYNKNKMYNPEMRAYIDEKLKELHSEKIADAEEVMEYLTSVMRGEQRDEAYIGAGRGAHELADIGVSSKDRIRAAELIGKRYGMFKEGINISGAAPVVICGSDALED